MSIRQILDGYGTYLTGRGVYPELDLETAEAEITKLLERELERFVGENFKNWGELETDEQHDKGIENELRANLRSKIPETVKRIIGGEL